MSDNRAFTITSIGILTIGAIALPDASSWAIPVIVGVSIAGIVTGLIMKEWRRDK